MQSVMLTFGELDVLTLCFQVLKFHTDFTCPAEYYFCRIDDLSRNLPQQGQWCDIKSKVHGVAKDMPWTTYIYMAHNESTRESSWETRVGQEYATKAM